jgi:protein-arginine kinase activator protein McsA
MRLGSVFSSKTLIRNTGCTRGSRCSSSRAIGFLLRESSVHLARRTTHLRRSSIDPEVIADKSVPIAYLQRQLHQAIDEEDYGTAAQLRDEIQ